MSHRIPTRHGGLSCVSLLVVLVACSVCEASTSETKLERQLLTYAPQILKKLREQGCKTVGVLKFRVQKAGGRVDDSAGTLNKLLADRLEAALTMANPADPKEQMQIVRDASSVAANIPAASHLSDEGRKRLFKAKYPLAWSSESVEVDRFITGLVQVAADKKSFRVGILAVGAKESKPKLLLPPFDVATDASLLNELGESFQLRSVPGQEDGSSDPAFLAQQVRQDPQTYFPLQNKPAVTLLIAYDDKPVSLEFRNGDAWIPEPQEGQKVTLELERLDSGELALGAVLKVNGENTLYRERFRDIDCQKWVLRPGWLKKTILGFQSDDKAAEEFRVASREESRGLEIYYGADVGTISLVVFQDMPPESATEQAELQDVGSDLENNNTLDLIAVARAQFPKNPPRDAMELKAQLRPNRSRGVIDRGGMIASPVRDEKHRWLPDPVLSIVIRYYCPKAAAPAQ
jgi:hypothetical protein